MSRVCWHASFCNHNDAKLALSIIKASEFNVGRFSVVRKCANPENGGVQCSDLESLSSQWSRTDRLFGGLWGIFFSGVICSLRSTAPLSVVGHLAAVLIASDRAWKSPTNPFRLDQVLSVAGLPEHDIVCLAESLDRGEILLMGFGADNQNFGAIGSMDIKISAKIAYCHCSEELDEGIDVPF